ncbi:Heterochromatin protein 1-binding protein 3 [Clarias magur]|uniref:Heterochromatin protein 1-binding protein 3 n=1 Tax=Clarias magur TaxID=1594786 RepID=A0A8J4XAN9_CLAMG|nr:Heterochromatin protein 1-binding protein 3 [Clarias magur]
MAEPQRRCRDASFDASASTVQQEDGVTPPAAKSDARRWRYPPATILFSVQTDGLTGWQDFTMSESRCPFFKASRLNVANSHYVLT